MCVVCVEHVTYIPLQTIRINQHQARHMNESTDTSRVLTNKALYTWLPPDLVLCTLQVSYSAALSYISSIPPSKPKPADAGKRVHRFPRPLLWSVSFSFHFLGPTDQATVRLSLPALLLLLSSLSLSAPLPIFILLSHSLSVLTYSLWSIRAVTNVI
jgi:hypothetical protein